MHLEEWITKFSEDNTKGRDFFATKKDKRDEACPTYTRGGAWLSHFCHSINLGILE